MDKKLNGGKKAILPICFTATIMLVSGVMINASSEDIDLDFFVEPAWTSLTGGSNNDQLESMVKTADGGFIGVGWTEDGTMIDGNKYGTYDGLIMKYDKDGNLQFGTTFGGSGADTLYAINETSDGGFISCGYTSSNKTGAITGDKLGEDDALIVKFNSLGQVEWDQRFGASGAWKYTSCRDIIENQDGTFTMVGYQYGDTNGMVTDTNNGERDGYITKMSKDGDFLWTQVFGGANHDSFNGVKQLPNGKFVVAGQASSSNSGEITETTNGSYDALIAEFDQDGNEVWHQVYGGSDAENFESLIVNDKGEIIIVGNTYSSDGDFARESGKAFGGADAVVAKFNADGEVLWSHVSGGTGDDFLNSVLDNGDGRYILSGSSSSSFPTLGNPNAGGKDGMIISIKDDGNPEFMKIFGGTGDDSFVDVVNTDNGKSYVLGGFSTSSNSGSIGDTNNGLYDALVTKFSKINIPTYDFPQFVSINLGEEYNPKQDMSVIDFEDGNITSKVTSNSNVDPSIPGFYETNYEVSDLDGNIVPAKQTVLVNDGTYEVGDKYVISSNDLDVKYADVNLEDTSIINAAKVKVYDKSNGQEIVNPDISVDKGSYQAQNGTYTITFTYEGETATSIFTVDNGAFPEIKQPNFYASELGCVIDYSKIITATDIEDGTVSDIVIDDSKVDINKLGMYELSITVTDKDGNQTKATMMLAITDENTTLTKDYVFQVRDSSQMVSAYTKDDAYHFNNSDLKVYQKSDGQLINNDLIKINYHDYQAKAGTYSLDFMVENDQSQFASRKIELLRGEAPVINAPNYLEVNQNEAFEQLGNITINDQEDGPIDPSKLSVSKVVDGTIAGIFEVEYSITDNDKNTSTFKQIIVVKNEQMVSNDQYVMYANNYTQRIGQVSHEEAIIQQLSKLAVYDKATNQLVENPKLTIDSSELKKAEGEYPVNLNYNGLKHQIMVKVTKGEMPSISGDSYLELEQGTATDLLSHLTITDREDGTIDHSKVSINQTPDFTKAGVYELEYTVTDSDDNVSKFSQQVVIKNDNMVINDAYVIYAKDYAIRVGQTEQTADQVITRADVRVYDKAKKQYLNAPQITFDDRQVQATAGKYPLIIKYANLEKKINLTVTKGETPIIDGAKDTEIMLGSKFEPLAQIKVSDQEDGTIQVDKLQVEGEVNVNQVGVYPVKYTITDTDQNVVKLTRYVVVKDQSTITNDDYVLFANDYDSYIRNLDLSNEQIIKLANVQIYNKLTNEYIKNPSFEIDTSKVLKKAGTYPVKIKYNTIEQTIHLRLLSGELPQITGDKTMIINKGEQFDPYAGMELKDAEDGVLKASDLSYKGSVDVNQVGVYQLEYTYVDTDLNKVSFTKEVIVKDENTTINEQFVMYAQDYRKRLGQLELSTQAISDNSNLFVYDRINKQYVPNQLIKIDKANLSKSVGTHKVKFAYQTITKQINVKVEAGLKPEIEAEKTFYEVKLGQNIDLNKLVTYNDAEDKQSTLKYKVLSNINFDRPGTYKVLYQVTDSDQNRSEQEIYIFVNDGTYVLNQSHALSANNLEYDLRTGIDLKTYILENANITWYDLTKEGELSLTPQVVNIDLSKISYQAGEYEATIEVNGLKKVITVTITNGEVPVLIGPKEITIAEGDNILNLREVKAYDAEDGELTDLVTSKILTINDKTKQTVLEYTVCDQDGNCTKFEQIVNIVTPSADENPIPSPEKSPSIEPSNTIIKPDTLPNTGNEIGLALASVLTSLVAVLIGIRRKYFKTKN